MAYGWFFTRYPHYETLSDTWRYHFGGIQEKAWLLSDPIGFLADLVKPRYVNDGGALATQNSLLNDVKDLLLYKLAAVCNLLTGNRYYVNVVLYNFITLFGLVFLAKFWSKIYPRLKPNWWLVIIGLLPSTLFWCSGFHKDGLLLSAAALGWWCVYQFFENKKYALKYLVIFAGSIGLMLLLRNVFGLVFLMATVCWWLANFKKHSAIYVGSFLMLCVLFFFTAHQFLPFPNLPEAFALRQAEFLKTPGQSNLTTPELLPTPIGFLNNLPAAINHGFLRPYPWEIKPISVVLAVIEQLIFGIIIIMAIGIFIKLKKPQKLRGAIVSGFLLWAMLCLVIGFTIPVLGAIVRYKAVAWPFILPPLIAFIYNYFTPKKSNV